jgi:tetratricopeptide (TPR) repeat protein
MLLAPGVAMEMLLSALLVVASYNIQGTVALESGGPMDSPIFVQLIKGTNIPIDYVYTTPTGSFTFQDVPAGLYYVRLQHEGFEDALQQVEVPSPGGILAVNLRLRRSHPAAQEQPPLGDRHQVNVRQLATPSEAIRHYEKASADLKDGKTERAIWHLQRAIQIAPDFLEAVYQLNDLFFQDGRYSDAEQILAKAIEVVPTEERLHLELARVFVRERKYKEALEQVDTYLQSNLKETDRAKMEKFRARLSRHVN